MFLFAILRFSLFSLTVFAADKCQPLPWLNDNDQVALADTTVISVSEPTVTEIRIVSTGYVVPGEVNCREQTTTGGTVGCCTCAQISYHYAMLDGLFFLLNPTVTRNCGNIKPNTPYCVDGCKWWYELCKSS